jgi:hypothetical protein
MLLLYVPTTLLNLNKAEKNVFLKKLADHQFCKESS